MDRSGSFRVNTEGETLRVKASLVEAPLEVKRKAAFTKRRGCVGKLPPGGETAGAGAGLSEGTARGREPTCRGSGLQEGRGAGERPGLRRSRLFRDTPRDVETQGRRREPREQSLGGHLCSPARPAPSPLPSSTPGLSWGIRSPAPAAGFKRPERPPPTQDKAQALVPPGRRTGRRLSAWP